MGKRSLLKREMWTHMLILSFLDNLRWCHGGVRVDQQFRSCVITESCSWTLIQTNITCYRNLMPGLRLHICCVSLYQVYVNLICLEKKKYFPVYLVLVKIKCLHVWELFYWNISWKIWPQNSQSFLSPLPLLKAALITKIYFFILTTCQMIMYNNMSLFTACCQNSNNNKIMQLQCQVPLELALRANFFTYFSNAYVLFGTKINKKPLLKWFNEEL